ncbi:MAG: DUF131 domain-containing protein [Candidatus Bathyarchaeota archaeon]|nr:DUF131 domain-containing protein [Candidatus Bathyarchaeota archaeon]
MGAKICEVCGERQAKYVCQECGRKICERCVEPSNLICLGCSREIEKLSSSPNRVKEGVVFETLPIKIFFLGFLLIFVGFIIIFLVTLFYGLKNSISLFLLIGPIPIILGAGEHAVLLTVLAIIVTIICAAIFIFLSRRRYLERRGEELLSNFSGLK